MNREPDADLRDVAGARDSGAGPDAEDLCRRLRSALASGSPRRLVVQEFLPAAVLVPLVERAGVVTLVFTARPHEMPTHGGQISFPGGRGETADRDATATALREASEELGIDATDVDVLGTLDDVLTPVGFVITPVVGWLHEPPAFRPDAREVEECFEVAFAEIADPACFTLRGHHEARGRIYPLPEYRVAGRVIWGATARMVQSLLEHVRHAGG